MVARVTLTPLSQPGMTEEIGTNGCDYYVIDEKDPIGDLTDQEYRDAVADYEREVTEGHHKDFTEYKGTAVMK